MLTRIVGWRGARRAFSLVELLIATVMLAVLAAVLMQVLVAQERFAAGVFATTEVRATLRHAAAALATDLRPLRPEDGDLYALEPGAVELRLTLGAAPICALDSARVTVTIPPPRPAAASLASWTAAPQRGDTVLAFDAGTPDDPDDDAWHRHVLLADPAVGSICPSAGGLAPAPDDTSGAWRLRVDPPLDSGAVPGTMLRVVRRARYEIYRGGDGEWYLGFLDCLATRATPCTTVQPVAGPFTAGGVRFAWLDAAGAPTTDAGRVQRIDVALHALARERVRWASRAPRRLQDSLDLSIGVRR